MFKKLGKKGLLSLLTVAAVVVTTVGSFAVWDTLTATSNGTLTLAKPIEVTTADMGALTETRAYEQAPEYAQNVTFEVADVPADDTVQLALDCAVKKADGTTDVTDKFDIEIKEKDGTALSTGDIDTTVTASNEYTVTITPKDTDDAKALADGTGLKVAVTGKLTEVVTPAP